MRKFKLLILLVVYISVINTLSAQDQLDREPFSEAIYLFVKNNGRFQSHAGDMEVGRFPFGNGTINSLIFLRDANEYYDNNNKLSPIVFDSLVSNYLLSSHEYNYGFYKTDSDQKNYKKFQKAMKKINEVGIINELQIGYTLSDVYVIGLYFSDSEEYVNLTITPADGEIGLTYISFIEYEILKPKSLY